MRLIDADHLKRQVEGRSWRAKDKMVELIDDSPTIRVGENTCKHRTPDGVCKLYTDEHFTSFCVDGPCPNEEPITEVEPVKHGEWRDYPIADGCLQCSSCGVLRMGEPSNFCPNCGAKMDLEGEPHEQN